MFRKSRLMLSALSLAVASLFALPAMAEPSKRPVQKKVTVMKEGEPKGKVDPVKYQKGVEARITRGEDLLKRGLEKRSASREVRAKVTSTYEAGVKDVRKAVTDAGKDGVFTPAERKAIQTKHNEAMKDARKQLPPRPKAPKKAS
jgi:hypothetical protein